MSLKVTNLSFAYGAKHALDQVSFHAQAGRFTALLGPNGAGKSTLFALLTRLFTPPVGDITIAEISLSKSPRDALARLGIVFQQPTLDLDLTVRQNLTYFAALHGLSGRDAQSRIDAALDRLSMRERSNEKARALNGGHRRRTEIARALLHNPQILLLDEPTVGLDAATRQAITAHVHRLTKDGLTVLWATHLTDEVLPDDDVILLNRGKIQATGRAQDVQGGQTLQTWFLEQTGSAV